MSTFHQRIPDRIRKKAGDWRMTARRMNDPTTPGSETTDSPSGRKRTTVLHPLLRSGKLLSTGSSRGCRWRPSRWEKAGTESGIYPGSSLISRVEMERAPARVRLPLESVRSGK